MSAFFRRMFSGGQQAPDAARDYREVVAKTAGMTASGEARRLARARGLEVLDLTWEDAGRYHGSTVGPNISDMTIQVCPSGDRPTCMPVIRFPNFSDRSCDVPLDELSVRVGNEFGLRTRRVPLREYLGDLRRYLSRPDSWAGTGRSLLAPNDRHVLVSAQACFLPVPLHGEATFNPVLFNYQSMKGSPAVLAVLATREGTSATVIDNTRDGFSAGGAWGQRLFFNQNGLRASFTGTRLTDFAADGGDPSDSVHDLKEATDRGLNQVLLIQVPLKQHAWADPCDEEGTGACFAAQPMRRCKTGRSDVDEAVIGHGEAEGPFTELDGLAIERDERFPIRVTVQLYQATSNGLIDAGDLKRLADQIDAIYSGACRIGSLVLDGDTGRSTQWDAGGASKEEPANWWEDFWRRQERATGRSREALLADLRKLLGRDPSQQELEASLRRVFGDDS